MSSIVTANLTRVVRVTDTSILVITGTQDLSGYQPLDSDLTAIAALTTTSFGRSTLTLADAAAMRTQSGLGTLATQNGTFSGTSSGTNTGDQDLGGYLTISGAAETYAPLDLPVFPAGITLGVEGSGDEGVLRLWDSTNEVHGDMSVDNGQMVLRPSTASTGGLYLQNFTTEWDVSGAQLTAARIVYAANENGVMALRALEKSANFTPIVGGVYLATATLTVTDPTPVQAAEFTVIVRNGTATVGPTAYSVAGTVIRRIYHSGAWANYPTYSGASGDALTSGTLAQFAATTSDQLRGVISDETGSGALVFANSPTLVTPALGTPASGVVTNLTGTASININGTVGATTPTTGAFTTLNTSGLVRLGTATTADATSDNLIATSATTQRGLTIQAKASQTASLLRLVESSNNANNNGWEFSANDMTVATSGSKAYQNALTQIGPPTYAIKWSSSASNPFATETCSIKCGTGSPEGVTTSRPGSLYLRTDGGTLTSLYVKESGTGNTGWIFK